MKKIERNNPHKNTHGVGQELYANGKTTICKLSVWGLLKLIKAPQGYTVLQFQKMIELEKGITVSEKTAGITLNNIIGGIEGDDTMVGVVTRDFRAGKTKSFLYRIVHQKRQQDVALTRKPTNK